MSRHRRLRTRILQGVAVFLVVCAVPLVLFVINGTLIAANQRPVMGTTAHAPAPPIAAETGGEVTLLSYNIAKAFAHLGGLEFERRDVVEARLRRVAEVIRAERPHLVFLSEVLREHPDATDQLTFLAEETGMHAWAFGEHYNVGLPFLRVVGGAAILSRWPLEPVVNMDLAGRQPFWVALNNRRALWCAVTIAGERVLLASLHLDSFRPPVRLEQARQILEYSRGRPAVLAGDLNAGPGEPPIELIRDSGRFTAELDGPPTFPADAPDQTIDLIFAPASWDLVSHRVIETDASDHRPVVSTFRVPAR